MNGRLDEKLAHAKNPDAILLVGWQKVKAFREVLSKNNAKRQKSCGTWNMFLKQANIWGAYNNFRQSCMKDLPQIFAAAASQP